MKKVLLVLTVAAAMLSASGCSQKMKKINLKPYPETAKSGVVDNYHGTEVADPYRWLEDDNSAETAAWVKAQNEVTFDYLAQIPYRETVKNRLTELWNYEKIGAPTRAGDHYFFFRNDGLQNQSVLYIMNGMDDKEPKIFIDPNTLSSDGTSALGNISFSEDGKYMAYTIAKAGSDWVDIFVKEIPSGRELSDKISWVKFSGADWAADSKGFYYSAYDAPEKGSELSGQNQYQKVYYHALGTPQSSDKLIYSDNLHPLRYFNGADDGDKGKWLFVYGSEGTHGTEVLFKQKNSSAAFKVLFPGFMHDYEIVRTQGDIAYVYTNDKAPNYRLATIDLREPGKGMTDVIPEDKGRLLSGATFAGGYLFAHYMEDAQVKVYQHKYDGTLVRPVELPAIGSAGGFSTKEEDKTAFYSFSNFTTPATVYKYDVETGVSEKYFEPKLRYNPNEFTSEQIFFTSKDGTRVPMFVVHRKDIKLDGNNPAYMYGYGGFNSGRTPGFSLTALSVIEQGGVYVLVNLRGGNEYGEEWHRAGMLESKQNVFDDFIAAGEYLVKHGYTSAGKLGIAGGSNGGLLVGACMTQRPDLFAVALPAVGVMDMLRYHLFTVGWGWVVEYGSSADPEQFEYIYKYSPLHNIKEGVCYPATLITTADHDDRVVPAHSFKFAAVLQAAQGCDRPALIRIETNAGHGAGKPTAKAIEETADVLSFFFWNTGVTEIK